MNLYYVIKERVFRMTYDEMDEYVKNHFKGMDVPLEVPISFKEACPYLKGNAGEYEVFRDKDYQNNTRYAILYEYGTQILNKGSSLMITKDGSLYVLEDSEFSSERYMKA